ARALSATLAGIAPDIVHLHSTFPGVYGRIFKSDAAVIYCPHGWSFVQEEGRLKKALYARVEKSLARRCDAIINISTHEYDEAARSGLRHPAGVVILSGVDDRPATDDASSSPAGMLPDFDPAAINIG